MAFYLGRQAVAGASRPLRRGGSNSVFEWHFAFPHEMHHNTEALIRRPVNPLGQLLSRRWREADKSTLWIYAYSPNRVCKSSFIRGFHNRRIRAAIREALKDKGLDGRGLPLKQENTASLGSTVIPMVGSLAIIPKTGVLVASYKDLLQASRAMVSSILKSQPFSSRTTPFTN